VNVANANGLNGVLATTFSDYDLDVVSEMPLFKSLPRVSLEKLLDRAAVRTCTKGQILFLDSDPAEYIYVILDGSFIISCNSAEGDEGVIGIAGFGDILAQEAIFADQIYPYCAEAHTDSQLLSLSLTHFRQSVEAIPELAAGLLTCLSQRIHQLTSSIETLKTRSATQRVVDFLLLQCPVSEGSVVVPLPYQKGLISLDLGIRPESLSRILQRLRKYGVRAEGNHISISDVSALNLINNDGEGRRTAVH